MQLSINIKNKVDMKCKSCWNCTTQVVIFFLVHSMRLSVELTVFEKRKQMAFINGFSYWHDGGRKIRDHGLSESHSEALLAYNRLHSAEPVSEMLDKTIKLKKQENHDMLSFVVESMRFLTRQGMALRGDYSSTSKEASEPNSNVNQLLKSYGRISDRAEALLQRTHTYNSPEIQNELANIKSNIILRELVEKIKKAEWYTVMVDETADVTGKEQAVICFR